MLDSLDGKCPFTPEQVKSRLDSVKEAMTSLTASIESLETRLADSDRLTQELKEQHQQLLSWAEMFDTASRRAQAHRLPPHQSCNTDPRLRYP